MSITCEVAILRRYYSYIRRQLSKAVFILQVLSFIMTIQQCYQQYDNVRYDDTKTNATTTMKFVINEEHMRTSLCFLFFLRLTMFDYFHNFFLLCLNLLTIGWKINMLITTNWKHTRKTLRELRFYMCVYRLMCSHRWKYSACFHSVDLFSEC